MDTLEEIVDEVLVVWQEVMARSPSGLSRDFWECERGALGELGPVHQEIEDAVLKLENWRVDRADVIAAARQAWAGDELSVNFDAIADELMTLAQIKLFETLISKGLNRASAAKAATCFRLGGKLARAESHAHVHSAP
jgi:hypothetical protein